MKSKVIIRGGFLPTINHNKKQIDEAIKEVDNYNKKANNLFVTSIIKKY